MPYLFPLFAVIIWAGNALINKLAVGVIEPGAISFYRWFFAVLILTPFVLKPMIRNRRTIIPHLPKLAALALLGMVIFQSLAYFAAQSTTATNIALISSLVPLISMFISVPLLKQPLSKLGLTGAVISFSGLLYMLSKGNIGAIVHQGINHGDALLLLAACSYALYSVLIKRWQMVISVWISVYVQGLFAVLFLLPILWSAPTTHISHAAWPLVMYAAIGASLFAPWAWIKGINLLGADKNAMLMNLMPLFVAIAANYFLNEQFYHYHYIGGSMVIFGVILAQLKLNKKAQAHTAIAETAT